MLLYKDVCTINTMNLINCLMKHDANVSSNAAAVQVQFIFNVFCHNNSRQVARKCIVVFI